MTDFLDLDELLAGEPRLAEKVVLIVTAPWLAGEIDELEGRLAELTDHFGNPLGGEEEAALQIATEIESKRREHAESQRTLRLRALPSDRWRAFDTKWIKPLKDGDEYPDEMWDHLISACALEPAMTPDQVAALRARLPYRAIESLKLAAFEVCTKSGTTMPQTPRAARVLALANGRDTSAPAATAD